MKGKQRGITILLIVMFAAGLGLVLYPFISRYWTARQQSAVIVEYAESRSEEKTENEILLEEAAAYNEQLGEKGIHWLLTEEEREAYQKYLATDSTGIMSYIEIPVIDCQLPIYHGTGDAVLQAGVGHLEGSSLPVGGKSSHCALSGHTGLPSAELFNRLDEMKIGDTFLLHTLGETLTYEVDQICVVEPTDLSELQIQEGEDYCTLITCTPYGVNSHRLLVRGRRVDGGTDVQQE